MFYRTRFEKEITSLLEYEEPVTAVSPVTRHLAIKRNSSTLAGRKIGVHVPPKAAKASVLDVIVYFHGFVGTVCNEDAGKFRLRGMDHYWEVCWFKKMLAELDASGRAAILIAPTLHPLVGERGSGPDRYDNLNKEKLFDKLIDDVLAELKKTNDIDGGASVGKIVLAAHSGGGAPMAAILQATNPKYKSKIWACWGFECLYPAAKAWNDWLATHKSHVFRHFRKDGVFDERAAEIKATLLTVGMISNTVGTFVDRTTDACKPHCNLLRMYWADAIAFMSKTPNGSAPY
jgi:hypothetical protein